MSGNVFVFQINYVKEVEALSSEGELNRNVQNWYVRDDDKQPIICIKNGVSLP